MAYGLPYNLSNFVSFHIPHVFLGLHYIKLITKGKIHIGEWIYETKLLIGQDGFK